MITFFLDVDRIYVESIYQIIKIEIHEYHTNKFIRYYYTDLEFPLEKGVYRISIYYVVQNQMKRIQEIFCMPYDLCMFCNDGYSDYSFKEHPFIKMHQNCFYKNKHQIIDFCKHSCESHHLENDDINVVVPVHEVHESYPDTSDEYKSFHCSSFDLIENKNILKIFDKGTRMQIDSESTMFIFNRCFRFYNPKFEIHRIEDFCNFRIVILAHGIDSTFLSKHRFQTFALQARYQDFVFKVYIITTSDKAHVLPERFHIYSDLLIVL